MLNAKCKIATFLTSARKHRKALLARLYVFSSLGQGRQTVSSGQDLLYGGKGQGSKKVNPCNPHLRQFVAEEYVHLQ